MLENDDNEYDPLTRETLFKQKLAIARLLDRTDSVWSGAGTGIGHATPAVDAPSELERRLSEYFAPPGTSTSVTGTYTTYISNRSSGD